MRPRWRSDDLIPQSRRVAHPTMGKERRSRAGPHRPTDPSGARRPLAGIGSSGVLSGSLTATYITYQLAYGSLLLRPGQRINRPSRSPTPSASPSTLASSRCGGRYRAPASNSPTMWGWQRRILVGLVSRFRSPATRGGRPASTGTDLPLADGGEQRRDPLLVLTTLYRRSELLLEFSRSRHLRQPPGRAPGTA
jgi:hypothetical protein